MPEKNSNTIRVWLRFYGQLNDLLPAVRRKVTFNRILPETTTVKDLIEGCGVPHTEVGLVLIDGCPNGFERLVRKDERVSVYPVFVNLAIPESYNLQVNKLHSPRFVVDVHLGKLTRYLRMAGFDTAYRNDANDKELIRKMLDEGRVLLTRDRRLLMHKVVKKGYFVRSDQAVEQLEEVLLRFDLSRKVRPFTRCIHCNGRLEQADKSEVFDQLEPLTKRYYNNFARCMDCKQIYWAGSHRDRFDPKLKKILDLA